MCQPFLFQRKHLSLNKNYQRFYLEGQSPFSILGVKRSSISLSALPYGRATKPTASYAFFSVSAARAEAFSAPCFIT